MPSSVRSRVKQASALAWLAASVCSSAGVVTAAVTISAKYQQACQITATVPVFDFGNLTSNSTVLYTSATLIVSCDSGAQTPFGVWAPLSANANGTQRRMKNSNTSAGNYLNYNLLIGDSGSTTISSTATTTGFANPQGGTTTGVLLRAQLPAGQTLTQGYYSDDLILTVSY
jgi:spore coat protein U-like protein